MHILLYWKCFWKYKVTVTTVFFLHVHVADFGVAGQLTVSHNAHWESDVWESWEKREKDY